MNATVSFNPCFGTIDHLSPSLSLSHPLCCLLEWRTYSYLDPETNSHSEQAHTFPEPDPEWADLLCRSRLT